MNRIIAVLLLIITIFVAAGTALAGTTIPLELAIALDASRYIQPTCAKCEDLELEVRAGGTEGRLTLTYHDEQQRDFEGAIEVTVELMDGNYDIVLIESVSLRESELASWSLDAQAGWNWLDVQKAELRLQAE